MEFESRSCDLPGDSVAAPPPTAGVPLAPLPLAGAALVAAAAAGAACGAAVPISPAPASGSTTTEMWADLAEAADIEVGIPVVCCDPAPPPPATLVGWPAPRPALALLPGVGAPSARRGPPPVPGFRAPPRRCGQATPDAVLAAATVGQLDGASLAMLTEGLPHPPGEGSPEMPPAAPRVPLSCRSLLRCSRLPSRSSGSTRSSPSSPLPLVCAARLAPPWPASPPGRSFLGRRRAPRGNLPSC
nr:atherin-like [Aegilops tauschii subsp. strangulata]